MDLRLGKMLVWTFCCIALAECLSVTFYATHFAWQTYISLVLVGIGVYYILSIANTGNEYLDYRKWLWALMAWNLFTIVRGVISASSYWDWKFLLYANMPALLIPTAVFLGGKLWPIGYLYRNIFHRYFLISFAVLLLMGLPSKIIYLWTPLYFFILAYRYMRRQQQRWILLMAAMLLVADFSARSNIIRVIMAIGLCLSFYYVQRNRRFINMCHKILFALPLLFVALGVSGVFNIFDMQSYLSESIEVTNAAGTKENLMADTRTLLYTETLTSMEKKHSFLFGEGGCGGYVTRFFANTYVGSKRYGSEVGALNTMLYSGIFGLALYGIVFFLASQLAIQKSNNTLVKLIGLFIVLRWDYFFVEEFTSFNTNYFGLWLMIGMCLSPTFRDMTDEDIERWIYDEDIEEPIKEADANEN